MVHVEWQLIMELRPWPMTFLVRPLLEPDLHIHARSPAALRDELGILPLTSGCYLAASDRVYTVGVIECFPRAQA